MKTLSTMYYSEIQPEGRPIISPELLVTDVASIDIDAWVKNVETLNPTAVIPPYDPMDPAKTSACADMARSRLPNVGVVVAGTSDREREEFFMWAQENKFAPIVLLPHRYWDRSRQIAQLHATKLVRPGTWIHLPQPVLNFIERSWLGNYTTGEEFVRQI